MPDIPAYTQARRLLRIDTPLGEDVLLLEAFDAVEEISELFVFKALVRSKQDPIDPGGLIGQLVDVSLDLSRDGDEASPRVWNALCTDVHEGERLARGLRHYTLTLRPQLWLLTRRSDCRIFLDQSSVDICQAMLAEHGLPSADTSGLVGPSPPQKRDYSVQWNETDLTYLDRRLEQDGIFYHFEHVKGRHTMHLANHQAAYREAEEPRLRFAPGSTVDSYIGKLDRTYSFIPSRRAGRDWNFMTPRQAPEAQSSSLVKGPASRGSAQYELYEFPGRFSDSGTGEAAMRNRMQAVETDHNEGAGASSVRTLSVARRFTPFEEAYSDAKYEPQIATRVEHHVRDPTYEAGSTGVRTDPGGQGKNDPKQPKPEDPAPSYENRFAAQPAAQPATPHRDTPRPSIDGAQIATVAGPPGEEIFTDGFGRVKLKFPWDRRAKGDGSDTVWVRVSQPWAGGTWGAQVIPRIGMEVLVTYQDGDPDRPLVTGIVPNPANPVPYALPDNKTRMVLRSQTYKGEGFNELAMEDQPGAERLHLHAQHDHTTKVGNNQTERVDAHQVQSVGGSRSVEVAGNQKHEVGGSMNVVVGGVGAMAAGVAAQAAALAPMTASILSSAGGGGFAASIGQMALGFLAGQGLGARQGVVAGSSPRADAGEALSGSGGGVGDAVAGLFGQSGVMNTIVGSFSSHTVGVASVEQVGVAKVVHAGQSYTIKTGATYQLDAGQAIEASAGKTVVIDAGDAVEITAGQRIVLKAGGARLELDAQGIAVLEGAVSAIVKGAGAQLTVGPGPILHIPEIVPGAVAAPSAPCLRRMAGLGPPLVRS